MSRCDDKQSGNGSPLTGYCRSGLVLAAAVIMLTTAVRVRLLPVPLERDEGEYAYAGRLIMQGVAPYEQAYNMKMPGVYAAYALIMAAFGQNQTGIHIGLLVLNIAAVVFVFLLVKDLFDVPAGAAAVPCRPASCPSGFAVDGLVQKGDHDRRSTANQGPCRARV